MQDVIPKAYKKQMLQTALQITHTQETPVVVHMHQQATQQPKLIPVSQCQPGERHLSLPPQAALTRLQHELPGKILQKCPDQLQGQQSYVMSGSNSECLMRHGTACLASPSILSLQERVLGRPTGLLTEEDLQQSKAHTDWPNSEP